MPYSPYPTSCARSRSSFWTLECDARGAETANVRQALLVPFDVMLSSLLERLSQAACASLAQMYCLRKNVTTMSDRNGFAFDPQSTIFVLFAATSISTIGDEHQSNFS